MSETMLLSGVHRVRRALTRLVYARATLLALGVALSVWLVADGVGLARGAAPIGMGRSAAIAFVVAFGVALAVSWALAARRTQGITDVRAALWLEERGTGVGTASFALVTLVEALVARHSSVADAAARAVSENPLLQASARAVLARTDVPRALRRSARNQLLGPALFAGGALTVLMLGALVRSMESGTAGALLRAVTGDTAMATPIPAMGAWNVRVDAPAYTRRAPQQFGDIQNVAAVRGSTVRLRGTGPVPETVIERLVGEAADSLAAARRERRLVPATTGDGWEVRTVATDGPVTLQLERGGRSRLLVVEGRADSIPIVSLVQPARDSVFRTTVGSLALVASVRDDIGLANAHFELIVSSGDGERFTARTVQMGARAYAGDRAGTIRATMDIAALKLVAGDIVHLRAIARDAHPASNREFGSSETRSFRIARVAEYDSVAVEPAPPPEVDKSLLSQRMLLMLTEKLEKQRPTLERKTLLSESTKIGRDQARLRQAVGDVVFQRLSGDVSGEHTHSAGDGHDHGVEQQQGKLALSGGNTGGVLEEGDDSPVIAINQPLLEAYNAMWDAGRELEQGDPKAAIPHMRLALAAIERARSAERLYLRGKPPTVIIDIAKVRLAGKDTGVTNLRRSREALPPREARRAVRLVAAAQLVPSDASAARDSLAVLRAEALGDSPAFAAAVGAVLDVLGREGDVTDAFIRARRVLGGVVRTEAGAWSRGVPQ
ncbi:hypothetical protein [Gemmatimonas groenlandica]|uniref:DUF4175 domain-containing protein n=1 Tax=Gemmatimonas groenlandica TaxID=2732249 RepID=A0A6M4IQ37_9BACT|nr:hypothetical protein [Gemmatimonas groenlandica]QJR35869.1 hypothetical protein HKW67_10280 [Gemmatimonas groenlandica]